MRDIGVGQHQNVHYEILECGASLSSERKLMSGNRLFNRLHAGRSFVSPGDGRTSTAFLLFLGSRIRRGYKLFPLFVALRDIFGAVRLLPGRRAPWNVPAWNDPRAPTTV